MSQLRERVKQEAAANGDASNGDMGAGFTAQAGKPATTDHPSGQEGYSGWFQIVNASLFNWFMLGGVLCAHSMQLVGALTYFVNRNWYYLWISFTKQQFALITNAIMKWFAPTKIRISGDASVKGQLRLDRHGRLQTTFPERLVMIANHQIYTDWLYLWWTAYTSRMHGHLFIILKESLKYIPLLGPGMMFYGFIFLARNWAKDKERFHYRLQKLNSSHKGAMAGPNELDPMWLLIFPEGTNLSPNGRRASAKWAKKTEIDDMRHQLLPRSTGMLYCLQELRHTVEWVYDCTITYEGIPDGAYGQNVFTLRSVCFQGRSPKSVNMYWRRFHISSIPLDDSKAFEDWILQRWREKDELIEGYRQTGRLPRDESGGAPRDGNGYMETRVESRDYEWLLVFAPMVPFFIVMYAVCFLIQRWGFNPPLRWT